MKRKYLAFDLETAKDVPGESFDWRPHRPLGITCAAAHLTDAKEPIIWHGKLPDGSPSPCMSKEEVRKLVEELLSHVENGYTVLTWNGLGFDFDILAEESGYQGECKDLALGHVDMMFHVFCDRGFPVALNNAAKALEIPGKPDGMSGLMAPKLWAEGKYREILDYVVQDVRITQQVAVKCEEQRRFDWITQRGKRSSVKLSHGWLSVTDALRLPEPDTSWMDKPMPRRDFTQWLD